MVIYLCTGPEAKDWGTGLPLKQDLLGKMSSLEVHHIFPKAQLYKFNYQRADVNALANYLRKKAPEKGLVVRLKKTSGRNFHGKITAHHRGGGMRRLYRQIDWARTGRSAGDR